VNRLLFGRRTELIICHAISTAMTVVLLNATERRDYSA